LGVTRSATQVAAAGDRRVDPGETGLDFGAIPLDKVLLRFLRAHDFDVDGAFVNVTSTIQWRKDFGADQMLNVSDHLHYYN